MFGPPVMVATPPNDEGVRHAVALGGDHTACGLPLDELTVSYWQQWPNGADGPKGSACEECSDVVG